MAWLTKSRVKYVLAAVGAGYVVLFVGYLVFAAVSRPASPPPGPSELEAHPERQDEILAQRRAEEMKQRLNLSDDQTQKLAEIFKDQKDMPPPGPPEDGDFPPEGGDRRARREAFEQKVAAVLTPEQRTQAEELRSQMRKSWGPMSPERIESLKQKMTPEQQARFDKALKKMQRRGGSGGPGSPGGGRRGPGGEGRKRPKPGF